MLGISMDGAHKHLSVLSDITGPRQVLLPLNPSLNT